MTEVAVLLCSLLVTAPADGGDLPAIDHRFAPDRQYTLLSFPFDWQKTIVLGDGSLAYDFGPGPYHEAGTTVAFGFAGSPGRLNRQFFADPRVPLATSVIDFDAGKVTEEALCIVSPAPSSTGPFVSGPVSRTGHLAGTVAWSGAAGAPDGLFRNVAWGTNRPITYAVAVPKGARKVVALGVCEAYKSGPGQRILEFRVEGAEEQTVDPILLAGRNIPLVLLFRGADADGDGRIRIEARCAPLSPDPNVIMNALWVFPEGTEAVAESIALGRVDRSAEVVWSCGTELSTISPIPRRDVLSASFAAQGGTPGLSILTRRPVSYDATRGIIDLGVGMRIRCSPPPGAGIASPEGRSLRWFFPYGRGTVRAALIIEHGPPQEIAGAFPDLQKERDRSAAYWRTLSAIPFGVLSVPDTALQHILDVNIRNLYQAADMVDGYPVFQPGPTVYRGLFLLDALMMGETLMLLGDTSSMGGYLEGTFRYQQPDGRVRVASPYNSWLETPVFVHALGWYARWTGNREWMTRQWPRMVRGVEWIQRTRASTMGDSAAANYGLFPAGFVDGGLAGAVADFSTASFALVALEEAAATAFWLGHPDEGRAWQALFDELLQSYLHAARRSVRTDRFGNRYLPVAVGDTAASTPPQRGQYGFFMPLRLSRYYRHPDPMIDSLIDGNLGMLDSTLAEGMVPDAGWTNNAVWSWFGAMHAATLAWRGRTERAARMIYDVANHAGRLGTWVEEQQIRGRGTRSTGDGANAEASAFFITAVRNLLATEQDSIIRLLPGIPAGWLRPGSRIAINGSGTAAGRLTLEAKVSEDGSSLVVSASLGVPGRGVLVLATGAIRKAGFTLPDGSPPARDLTGRSPAATWKFINVH
jgi:hypothetical protein